MWNLKQQWLKVIWIIMYHRKKWDSEKSLALSTHKLIRSLKSLKKKKTISLFCTKGSQNLNKDLYQRKKILNWRLPQRKNLLQYFCSLKNSLKNNLIFSRLQRKLIKQKNILILFKNGSLQLLGTIKTKLRLYWTHIKEEGP